MARKTATIPIIEPKRKQILRTLPQILLMGLTVAVSRVPLPPDLLHFCRSQALCAVWFAAQESVGLWIS